MNIKRIEQEISAPMTRNGETRVSPGDQDFKKILQELTANPPKSPGDVPAGSQTGAPSPVENTPIPFLNEPALPGQTESVQATENVLNLLEQYQTSLADPRVSLKEMDGLLQSLSRELKALAQVSERLSPADPLKKITTEVGLISFVEIEKFNQGRYI